MVLAHIPVSFQGLISGAGVAPFATAVHLLKHKPEKNAGMVQIAQFEQ
jgi:hypothetical protein